jgi:hypothetical protein
MMAKTPSSKALSRAQSFTTNPNFSPVFSNPEKNSSSNSNSPILSSGKNSNDPADIMAMINQVIASYIIN